MKRLTDSDKEAIRERYKELGMDKTHYIIISDWGVTIIRKSIFEKYYN